MKEFVLAKVDDYNYYLISLHYKQYIKIELCLFKIKTPIGYFSPIEDFDIEMVNICKKYAELLNIDSDGLCLKKSDNIGMNGYDEATTLNEVEILKGLNNGKNINK